MVFGKVLERDPSNTTARIHQAKVAKATVCPVVVILSLVR